MRRMNYHNKGNKQLVILAALTTMLILVFAVIIIVGKSKADDSEAEVTITEPMPLDNENMSEELGKISSYLGELDTTILDNQESLDGIHGYGEAMDSQFTLLDESLTDIDTFLTNFMNQYDTVSDDIVINLTAIQEEVAEVKTEIRDTKESIEMLIWEGETADVERQSEIKKQFESVSKAVSEVQNKLALSYESIVSMLDILQLDADEKQLEVITMLTELEGRMSELFTGQINTLTELMVQENYELQIAIENDVKMLSGRMTSLHEQIIATQDDLTVLWGEMEDSTVASQEEMNAAFIGLQDSLFKINQDFREAYADTQALLTTLQTTEVSNHGVLMTVLEEMETGMKETSDSNLINILNSMSDMQAAYNLSFDALTEEMDQSFENLDTHVNNQFADLDTSVNNRLENLDSSVHNRFESMDLLINSKFEKLDTTVNNKFDTLEITVGEELKNITAKINEQLTNLTTNVSDRVLGLTNMVSTGDDGLRSYLSDHLLEMNGKVDAGFSSVEQKLESVFQFVSNGKQMIASALLTKNVAINEDATFTEIVQGILDIPQKVVIGVEEIPGTISYEYHDHSGSSSVHGGCYTIPVYHAHGDSCYKEEECPGSTLHSESHGDGWYTYTCSKGHEIYGTNSYHGNMVLACNNGSTITGYRLACGLSDGQIVGVHIIYESN